MNNPLVYCALAALCFGGWPILARVSALPPPWIAATVAVATMPVTFLGLLSKSAGPVTPMPIAITIGLTSGVFNGLGVLAYSVLIGWRGQSGEISKLIAVTAVMMPLVTAVGARIAFAEPFTIHKLLGFAVAAVAIWLLR